MNFNQRLLLILNLGEYNPSWLKLIKTKGMKLDNPREFKIIRCGINRKIFSGGLILIS